MLGPEILFRTKDVILQHALILQREMLRVSRTDELQDHLHELLAGQFRAGERVEDSFAVLGVEFFALGNTASVSAFEFDPPVRVEFG